MGLGASPRQLLLSPHSSVREWKKEFSAIVNVRPEGTVPLSAQISFCRAIVGSLVGDNFACYIFGSSIVVSPKGKFITKSTISIITIELSSAYDILHMPGC